MPSGSPRARTSRHRFAVEPRALSAASTRRARHAASPLLADAPNSPSWATLVPKSAGTGEVRGHAVVVGQLVCGGSDLSASRRGAGPGDQGSD